MNVMPRRQNSVQAPSDGESADRRPSLGPAIVSGGCAVVVALITGLFNWINRPSQDPPAHPPTLTVSRPMRTPEPVRTASLDVTVPQVQPRVVEPQYGLNFAAYQAVIRDRTLNDEVRQAVIGDLQGHTVMWEGYVRSVTEFKNHDQDWIASIELVGDASSITQTAFGFPAHCRFDKDSGSRLKQVERGDLVTITGEFEGHTIATEVTHCHLVAVHGDSPSKPQ